MICTPDCQYYEYEMEYDRDRYYIDCKHKHYYKLNKGRSKKDEICPCNATEEQLLEALV